MAIRRDVVWPKAADPLQEWQGGEADILRGTDECLLVTLCGHPMPSKVRFALTLQADPLLAVG